jgi:hypothetical protein
MSNIVKPASSKIVDPYFEVARNLTLKEIGKMLPVLKNINRDVTLTQIIQYEPRNERFQRLKEIVSSASLALFKRIYKMTPLSLEEKHQLLNLAIQKQKTRFVSYLIKRLPANSFDPMAFGRLYFSCLQQQNRQMAEALRNSPAFHHIEGIMTAG